MCGVTVREHCVALEPEKANTQYCLPFRAISCSCLFCPWASVDLERSPCSLYLECTSLYALPYLSFLKSFESQGICHFQ